MRYLMAAILGVVGVVPAVRGADALRPRELRTQTVNGVTYFQARLDRPANLWVPNWTSYSDRERQQLAMGPRLVPQDEKTRDVASPWQSLSPQWQNRHRTLTDTGDGVVFFGKLNGSGRASFLLCYARENSNPVNPPLAVEAPVEIDFSRAGSVSIPAEAMKRKQDSRPHGDDLEGWWAVAQAEQFALLEAQSPNFSFYGFARAAIQRKYNVSANEVARGAIGQGGRHEYQRLYELTTGAAAITESLQLERMLGQRRKEGPRNIDIAKVQGIDIAEHDWKKMMGDAKPDPEPLAKLVPHDNYYLHFQKFGKFIEMGDFLDQWGTTAARAYEVQSTDYRLKERYEKQICIKTSLIGRTLGPLVIKGLAITGSDPYFRDGTDLSVIFQVVNQDLFKAGVEPYLREARQEHGARVKEGREEYGGVWIETYVTPQREVSLYRAIFDEYVVYANSRKGIQRILDARSGKLKPLADSLDFQYMRTIFKLSDENEDGFLFLSDPFLRNVVGPAQKIKEKRRLEGVAGLGMATNAVLWHAWQNGKLPADLNSALDLANLTTFDLATLDQPTVLWDVGRQQAIGDRYNTLHFATPLIELPIETISETESQDYNQFRLQYLGLWRQYFDPVGMRFRIRGGEVGIETFILPLVSSSGYNELRRNTDGGTIPINVSPPNERTVGQLISHLSPEARKQIESIVKNIGIDKVAGPWLGDWFVIRFDDSPAYAKLAALSERDGNPSQNPDEWIDAFFQMPVTIGVQIRNPLVFAGVLTVLRTTVMASLPNAVTWEPMTPAYKGVQIVRIQATDQGLGMLPRRENLPKNRPAVYYALAGGVWYVSLQEQPIKDMIDRAEAQAKLPADARQVNSALYVSPSAAKAAKDFARGYLERESHQRALLNAPVWYAFQKCGLMNGKDNESARQAVLYQYLGYVPVSPDGAAYLFDPRTDEMTNTRHGSPRKPTRKPALDPESPLAKLLQQTLDINADLRFREDGVHTIVTIRRQK